MANKKRILLVVIFAFVLTFIGGTYAYWEWVATDDTRSEVTFTATPDFICSADGGGNLTSGSVTMAPSSCMNSEHAIMREIVVDAEILETDLPVYMDMWLDIDSLDTELSDSQYLRYALTTSSVSCTEGVISSGTFNGKTAGDKLKILGREFAATGSGTYYLYIWLDSAETDASTAGKGFGVSLNGKCSNDAQPEPPVLDNTGLIPVTINNNGVVTTISESDENWYNYSNKNWANAVLVTSSSRSKYHDTEGVTVSSSDILAYYVWVPRFKYLIWTTENSSAGNEESIDIMFEGKEVDFSLGTLVGTYRTHPAFWWDGDNDGEIDAAEKLAGIWVGKFETTGSSTSPTVLPNSSSLRGQNVSSQFTSSRLFSSSDSYGLSAEIDSHMMKNGEWGAVAYLSHSQYGINGEIRYNNNSNYTTGCGASTEYVTEASTSCQIAFAGADEYPQSTTGNITGVFDMSGGSWEYVMGNYNDTIASSGFGTLPVIKYYDKYTSTSSLTACNGGPCFGHALFETANWYTNGLSHADSEEPWTIRGGYYDIGTYAGIFRSNHETGGQYSNGSWRSVLINLPTYVIGYNANGGTDAPDGTIKVYGENIALSSTIPTRTNFNFVEWNTEPDGSGTGYAAGGTYSANAGITLYAIWRDATMPSVTITISNEVETQQSVIMNVRDKSGIVAYYYGTTNPESNNVTWTSVETTRNKRVDLTVNEDGIWYFAGKDEDGNIVVVNQEFYKTILSATNATVNPAYVLTAAGNKFILPRVVVSEKYNFSGWHTNSNFDGNAVTVYQPIGNSTLYGKVNPNIMTGGLVTIKGTNTVGEVLTAEITTAPTPSPSTLRTISYTYQWYYNSSYSASGGTAIEGATGSTYTIDNSLAGKYIYVIVTAHLNNYFDYVMDADFTDATNNNSSSVGGLNDAKVGSCITNLTYNGTEQTIANGGTNITFSGHKQTNAGSYTVTMTSIEGHFFEDGAKTKTMTCSIDKIAPTITLNSSTGTVDFNGTKTVNVAVSAASSVSGTLKITSGNTSYVTITNPSSGSSSVTMGSGVTSVTTSFIYKGIQATETDINITLEFTPSTTDSTNFSSTSTTYTVTAVNKIDNPLKVTANTLSYTGSAQSLVTTTNAQGKVYYSTSTTLLSSNYLTDGSETISTGTNAGTYTVYYYTPGNGNYKAASGSVTVTISPVAWPSLSAIITGTATYGSTLSGGITSTPSDATYTYKWYANSTNSTSGGTLLGSGSTLSLNSDAFGKYIYVVITASHSSGNYTNGTATDLIDTVNNGSVTVIARPITVTANSKTRTYDGTALTDSGCSITSGSFYSNHKIASCTMTTASTITNVGSVTNDVTAVSITNSSGTNVNEYYNVTLVDGTLTVNKRAATITANAQTIEYGNSIATGTSYVTATNLASGDSVTSVTLTASTTNVTTTGTITPSGATIKNSSSADVTNNYNISYELGTLVIEEGKIICDSILISGTNTYGNTLTATVTTTPSATYTYQWYANSTNSTSGGTAISGATGSTYKPTSAAFDSSYNGRYLYVVVTASKTNYKTTTCSDITDTTNNGTAKTAKRPVTIKAGSSSKVYDGIALTNNSCTLTSGTLAFSHTLDSCTMTTDSTITNVGEVANKISTVKFSAGNGYYDITSVNGSLEVTKAQYEGGAVSISGNLYYGETLTATVSQETTPPAGTYSYEWFATSNADGTGGTSVGTGNTLSLGSNAFGKYIYVVVTAKDSPTDNYYEKTFKSVTASVIGKRPITVTAGNSSKTYDGTALTNNSCTLTSGSFYSTHYLDSCTMTSASTITNVGSVDNVISTVVIKNSSGTNVTSYYDVSFVNGTLTINCKAFTGGSVAISGTNTYGSTLTAGVTAPSPAPSGYTYKWYVTDNSNATGGSAISGATSSTYQPTSAVFDSSYNGRYVYVEVVAKKDNYCDTTFKDSTDSKIAKRPITIKAGDASKVYDGSPLTNNTCSITSGSMAFTQTLTGCTMTSASTVTNVADSPVDNVIDTVEFSAGKNYYNITTDDGTLTVTKYQPIGGGVSITGNLYYGETLTATLTSGPDVPADSYSYEWFATANADGTGGTSVGTGNTLSLISSSFDKYVYVVVTANYNSSNYLPAYITTVTPSVIGKRPITVTADSNSKIYDGNALTDNGCTLTSGSFISTHYLNSCTMTNESTITNVGSVGNDIYSVTIKNSSGNNVTGYYDVTFVNGTLTVNCQTPTGGALKITGTNTYGNTLTAGVTTAPSPAPSSYNYQWYVTDNSTATGGSAISDATRSTYQPTSAVFDSSYNGRYVYAVATAVYDSNNYCAGHTISDITDATNNTTAKTAKRPITVTANSNSKIYDGTALTDSGCSLTSGSMAFSQVINSCTMTSGSTITNVGSVDNVISTVNLSSGGNYYTYTKVNGTLTVTCKPTPLTVSSTSLTFNDSNAQTATITYVGDGSLSCTSSNSSVATCKISGKTLTVTPVADGDATITVKASAGTNYCVSTNATLSVTVDLTKEINDKRYTCEVMYDGYDNTNRLTIYDITTCTSGTCTYDKIHGLDSSFDHTDNLFDVTWTVAEEGLKDKGNYSSIGAAVKADSSCSYSTRYIYNDLGYMNCRGGANVDTSLIASWDSCTAIYSQRVSKRVGTSTNNWWYAVSYDCYLNGTYLLDYEPSSCYETDDGGDSTTSSSSGDSTTSSSSGSGGSVEGSCSCTYSTYYEAYECTGTHYAVSTCNGKTYEELEATAVCRNFCAYMSWVNPG